MTVHSHSSATGKHRGANKRCIIVIIFQSGKIQQLFPGSFSLLDSVFFLFVGCVFAAWEMARHKRTCFEMIAKHYLSQVKVREVRLVSHSFRYTEY